MSEPRTLLHLAVTTLPPQAETVIAAQRADETNEIHIVSLADTPPEQALREIFAADSVCVWSPGAE